MWTVLTSVKIIFPSHCPFSLTISKAADSLYGYEFSTDSLYLSQYESHLLFCDPCDRLSRRQGLRLLTHFNLTYLTMINKGNRVIKTLAKFLLGKITFGKLNQRQKRSGEINWANRPGIERIPLEDRPLWEMLCKLRITIILGSNQSQPPSYLIFPNSFH